MSTPLLSIIIPCYNGSNYIVKTLQSILTQDETGFEIIVVDDGSTDNTKELIHSLADSRIQYHYQNNKGVSAARNRGLPEVKGNYVLFFDADDLMTQGFLSGRLNVLENNANVDFICGEVQKFDEKGLIKGYYRGTGSNAAEEILLYHPEIITCPSNYCFKTKFILNNKLLFNENLSSTADRFFIIHCSKYGKSSFDPHISKLYYRVDQNSMSHKLTKKLVFDNESYYRELVKYDLIPLNIKNKSLFLSDYILFASFWKVGDKNRSLKYAIGALLKNPIGFIKKCMIKK